MADQPCQVAPSTEIVYKLKELTRKTIGGAGDISAWTESGGGAARGPARWRGCAARRASQSSIRRCSVGHLVRSSSFFFAHNNLISCVCLYIYIDLRLRNAKYFWDALQLSQSHETFQSWTHTQHCDIRPQIHGQIAGERIWATPKFSLSRNSTARCSWAEASPDDSQQTVFYLGLNRDSTSSLEIRQIRPHIGFLGQH